MAGARIQLKRATAASWASNNPVLYAGEIGLETDTNKFKIGDGTTAFNSLSYFNGNLPGSNLNDLADVTIVAAADGDFLRWNGTAWINDAVNLGTDTAGSFVQSLVAGTGVTLTDNSGENTTPTIAIGQSVGTGDSPTFVNVTADLTGNASTATTLQTARNIAGQSFDGSANISIAPTDLTGVTSTAAELNILAGATPSTTELNYVDGVTSAIQTQIDTKAPLDSPTLTGTPTLPTGTIATTQTAGDNSTAVATTAFVGTAVSNLVDTAPEALNTLNELAAALGDDENFATTTATNLGLKAPIASPTFTGTVTVPAPSNNTDASTKAYVDTTASNTASNAATALSNHEADTTNVHGIADTSILVTTTGSQTLTNKTITSPAGLVKGDVGLGNVDNTSDANKPVSTATQTALDLKADLASPTFTGTVTVPTPTNNTDATTKAYVDSTASTTSGTASTALTNHEADTTNIHGIADTSILVTTTGSQTLTNKTITSPSGLVKGDVGLGNVDNTNDANKPVSTATQNALNLKANLASPTFTGTVTVPTPTNATDAATKAYADTIAAGINWHESVELATAAALPNSPTYDNGTGGVGSTLTATSNSRLLVDGTNATTGDRILVKDQATATQNGIYVVTQQGATDSTYLLTRATDHDGLGDNIVRGDAVYVGNGSSNVNQGFLINSVGSSGASGLHVVGTDDIAFTQFTGTANITAGTGITKTGNSLAIGQAVETNSSVTFNQVTAALVGNASTATTLQTARNIAGQSFNGSADISIAPTDLTGVTSTAAELNILTGAVLSTTELNYVDGVTSAIQTQLNTKAPLASPTFTGTVTIPTGASITAPTGLVKGDVGLGNVDNTSDANKPVSTATQTALDLKAPLASPTFTGTVTIPTGASITAPTGLVKGDVGLGNVDNTSNATERAATATLTNKTLTSPVINTPTGIVKGDVGLGNVDNTSDANKPVSTAAQTALDLKAPLASPTFTGTVAGITSTMVGLGNVDNTSDASKPVSTAQQTALNLKANLASPTLTGTVTVPTPTNDTDAATKAYVDSTVSGASISSLDDIGDVTITDAADGDYLKWNGTAFVNDDIDLGTDTVGDYVATITGGTGVTSSAATTGEGTTHTLSIGQAVGTSDNVTFNDVSVSGNLTVSGTTTSVNTETLTVDDNIVVLNNNATGAPTENAGIEVERGDSANVQLRWNETSDKWELTADGSTYADIATETYAASLTPATLNDIGDVTITSASSGQFLKWNGTAWVNDAIDLGTDTTGSYVTSLVAGTGVTLTNNSGEGATPTVEVDTTVIATLASPTFTGTVTVPTPTNGTDAANKTYADGVVTAAKIITAAGGDGTAGQALTTDGSGTLDFTTITGTTEASIISAVGGDGSSGQVLKTDGSGDLSFGDVALGTNTTGNYMADVSAGTGISIAHTPAEGSTATIALADVSTSAQTASYTLVLADKNKIVEMGVGSANDLTVPLNSSVAFPVGSQINILQTDAGQTTVVATGGVTINASPGTKLRAQWSYATLIKRATDTWVLVGDISA
jgi:trimeric autotransporter adhesin